MGRQPSFTAILLAIQCCAGVAAAEPQAPEIAADVDPRAGVGGGIGATLAPVTGNDIDPGDASGWAGSGPYLGQRMPPLRLKLTWPPILGITPLATATWVPGRNPLTALATTHFGAQYACGPFVLGTHFGLARTHGGVLLRNASYIRLVQPHFDWGMETISHYPLLGAPAVPPHLLLSSLGVRPINDGLRLRLDTAFKPGAAPTYSSIRAFGQF